MNALTKIVLFVVLPFWSVAQQGSVRFTEKFGPYNDSYKQDNDFTQRRVVHYPFVREADVLWKKVTWEIIDLREKANLPLYYPTDTMQQRKSLIQVIMDAISSNVVTPYRVPFKMNAYEFDALNEMSLQEVIDIGMREGRIEEEIGHGITRDSIVFFRWEYKEIKQFLIKELWYFDRKNSRLYNEIIGLCPIREFHPLDNDFNEDKSVTLRQRLFWVHYPEIRGFFAKTPVFSPLNDKPLYSFDDLFNFRYFNSYFVQEENVYNDRLITDYATGREAQLESERIKQEIFDFEQEIWEN
jgi:gliding motility associated protien GldN